MQILVFIATLITEIGVIIGCLAPQVVKMNKIINGQKCELRSDMLRIYYNHREEKTIRQYEYENFVELYEGYKALKGNSFIDKIYAEVKEWEIVS